MPTLKRTRRQAPLGAPRIIPPRRHCRPISATKRGTTKRTIPRNRVVIQKMKTLVRGDIGSSCSRRTNRLFTAESLLCLSRPRCRRPRPHRRISTEWISITANGPAESASPLPGEPAIIRALFCSNSRKITSRVDRLPPGPSGGGRARRRRARWPPWPRCTSSSLNFNSNRSLRRKRRQKWTRST